MANKQSAAIGNNSGNGATNVQVGNVVQSQSGLGGNNKVNIGNR